MFEYQFSFATHVIATGNGRLIDSFPFYGHVTVRSAYTNNRNADATRAFLDHETSFFEQQDTRF
jgi:hypothetical protein